MWIIRNLLVSFVFVCVAPLVNAQSPDCIDTDSDGWGWDGIQSCRPDDNNSTIAGQCIDTDGDGWGWDGIQSCRPDDNNFTTAGQCIDTDDDGWGWDGIQSCRPDDNNFTTAGQCIDTDGDGWGWDGVQSCRPDNNDPDSCITPGNYVEDLTGTCVGVPSDVELVDYSLDMSEDGPPIVLRDGDIIEGKRILGCIRINGANVTLRNNRIHCYKSRDIAWDTGVANDRDTIGDYYRGAVYVSPDSSNVLIENNSIVCNKRVEQTAPCDYGIQAENATVQFNRIIGPVDGIDARSNTVINYNLIENLSVVEEEWRDPVDFSHADGIQVTPSGFPTSNVTITGNVFRGVTSDESTEEVYDDIGAILVQNQSDSQRKPDVLIMHNYIGGHWPGNRIGCYNGAACNIYGNTIERLDIKAVDTNGSDPTTVVRCNTFDDGLFVESENANGFNVDNSNCMLP